MSSFRVHILCLAVYVTIQCGTLQAELLTVDVQVKTSQENNSRTGNKIYFSLIQGKGRRSKPQFATAQLRNSKKRNFTTGAVSSFRLQLDCKVHQIYGFRLAVGNSDDAWSCEGIKFQIVRDGTRSQIYSHPIPRSQRWFSAAANDGGKNARAKQYRDYRIAKPKFSVRNQALIAD